MAESVASAAARTEETKPSVKLALAATFTAEPIADSIHFWAELLGENLECEFAPYNQVFQQLLDPGSLLATNHAGVNILLVRPADWLRYEGENTPAEEKLWHAARELAAAVKSFADGPGRAKPLVFLCPSSSDGDEAQRIVRTWLANELSGSCVLQAIDTEFLQASYDVRDVYDVAADEIGHIPYTDAGFVALGAVVARRIHAVRHAPVKVVVTDCDGVLWNGVCGEVGPHGIEIDQARRSYQEFLVQQAESGVLIALCSKNSEQDVQEVFRRRTEMPLKQKHIVVSRVNWRAKSANLREIAAELSLGLDSFLFVDDNPVECAEVSANCPEVMVMQFPGSARGIERFEQHCWPLDRVVVTDEDRKRTASYRENAQREQVRAQASSLEEFLSSLQLQARIEPPKENEYARASQLTHRTNQFNCTTIRRSEEEIRSLCASGDLHCLVAEVKDRFGEYGLVGVVLYRLDPESLYVDTLLLSCRVLGRTVEHRILAKLAEIAAADGLGRIEIPFVRTKRNQPAFDFLQRIAGSDVIDKGEERVYRISAQQAMELPERCLQEPTVAPVTERATSKQGASLPQRSNSEIMQQIATELADGMEILRRIRMSQARNIETDVSDEALPSTPIEESIAAIWSEVLGIGRFGVNDDFFTRLGGDSLRGTQVISRIRQSFRLALPLRTLFDAPTVASLAMVVIEKLALADQGDGIDVFLAEVEDNSSRERLPSGAK